MIKGCILPWIHLYGDVQGDYRLCCHISPSPGYKVGDYTQPISSVLIMISIKRLENSFFLMISPLFVRKLVMILKI